MKFLYKIFGALLLGLLVSTFANAQHRYSEAEVQDLIENAPSSADYPQASAVILLSQKILTIHKDGSSTLDEHLLIKILKHRGKQKYGDQKRKYNTDSDSIQVIRAVTHKPGGKVVAVEPKAINDITPLELTSASVYTNIQEKVISFPALSPNTVMELKLRKVSEAPKDSADRHYWGMVGFQTNDPILRKEFVLIVPKDQDANFAFLHKEVQPEQTTFGDDRYVYNWRVEKSPQIITEPNMPPFEDFIPLLVFSSEKKWPTVGKWLGAKFFKHVVVTDSIRKKAIDLAKGSQSEDEKIRKIFLFVAQKIRNVYLQLGLAGYEPHDADSVLINRYGDTRDKSVLLVALLKAVGVTAYPAFVNAEPLPLIKSVPTPKQFDQIYVAVPRKNGDTLWLDPFADDTRYPYFIGGQGNTSLVVAPEKSFLWKVKEFPPEYNFSNNQLNCQLNKDGSVKTEITSRLNGYFDMRARSSLKHQTPKEIQQYFLKMANALGEGSREISHNLSNLKNLVEPAVIHQVVKTPDLGIVEGNMMIFRVPRVPYGFVHNPFFPSLEKRKFDFEIGSTMKIVLKGDITLPQGFKVAYVPETFSKESSYGTWKIHFSTDASGRIHYNYSYSLKKMRVPISDYPEFKKIFDDFSRPQNRLILLEKAGIKK